MSLVVDKITCVEESDEIGADDIYLIIFRGRTTAPFDSNLASTGPGDPALPFLAPWADFDTGETHGWDVSIAMTQADAVYAVMMVEKDSGKDITGKEVLAVWRAQTDLTWKATMLGFAAAGQSTSSAAAKAAGFNAVRDTMLGLASIYMEFPKGDDDVIRVRRVTIVTPGQSQKLRFRSDAEDATYDVTFKQV
jgi:hypothetical protein